MAYILAIDLGSTQLKLLLMNEEAQVVYVGTQGYPTQAPRAGWLEQRPEDWLCALDAGMHTLAQKTATEQIAAVSFSGHMSGVVLLDESGIVLRPCIMLADARSECECECLREKVGQLVRAQTGNPIINAFSLPKLLWLKQHENECWQKTKTWLSPKDYMRFCLTGKMNTEYTDAYNSLCVSRETANWSREIIAAAGLEPEKFPVVLRPFDKAGEITPEAAERFGLCAGTPVFAGGADMACGAVGMGLYRNGDSALTLGTCATFLAPVPQVDPQRFGEVTYHLHASTGRLYALGSHFNGGLAVNWITRMLSERQEIDFDMMDALSAEAEGIAPGSEGVLTLPFLAGSGSPYFTPSDRQTVLGCSAATTRAQLFRSQLEGITLNLAQTQEIFNGLVSGGLQRVLLGGGGSKISVWPQMIADVFHTQIDLVSNADASAVGAAIIGGFGAGIFPDMENTAQRCLTVKRTLHPKPEASTAYRTLYQTYLRAYRMVSKYYQEES